MKGGYNNGTNSSAAAVLGLTTALSQARINKGQAVGNSTVTNDSFQINKNGHNGTNAVSANKTT